MRLISWNINARTRSVPDQVEFLARREPDIIALQEVTANNITQFRDGLKAHGFLYALDSFEMVEDPSILTGPRRYGVLAASRYPVKINHGQALPVPWEEKVLAASIHGSKARIELTVTYVPPGSTNGWIKVETLEGLFQGLSARSSHHRLLCGDFNTPMLEFPSGEIVTWAQRISQSGEAIVRSRFRKGEGSRWDEAERNILERLAEHDLIDVYRALNGWEAPDYSWIPIRKNGNPVGRRFDHVFASRSLLPKSCHYLSVARENGLSDHAPVEADFEFEI